MRCLIFMPLLLAVATSLARPQTPSFQPSFQAAEFQTGCGPANGSQAEVAVGDFNGDQKPDVAVVCYLTNQISVLLGNGDGTFKPFVPSPPLSHYVQGNILAFDVNGDGRDDLVFTTDGGPELMAPTCVGTMAGSSYVLNVMLSKGNGEFAPASTAPTGGFYALSGAADLNGDGMRDLVFSDANGFDFGVMLGAKGGAFSTLVSIPGPTGQCWGVASTADFNHDGKPDIVLANSGFSIGKVNSTASMYNVLFLMNQGNLSFASPALVTSFDDSSESVVPTSVQVVTGDFNGDDNLDLGVNIPKQSVGVLSVYLGDGHGGFLPAKSSSNVNPSSSPKFNSLLVLDLNGDGKADLAQDANDNLDFYISNGDGTFHPGGFLAGYQSAYTVVDLNGDGKPDLVGMLLGPLQVLLNTTAIAEVTSAQNAASLSTTEPLTPGSLASIFGSGFTAAGVAAEAGTIPLPLSLGQVSVTVGGFPAPLLYVSTKQINFQVPWEVTGNTADIVVNANGTMLPPFHAALGEVSPGIFTTQYGSGQAIAINADGSLAGPAGSIPGLALHPASAGDVLLILATGLGAVSPQIADGANSADARRDTTAMPSVMIGGQSSQVLFSGLSPQFVGVNQINVVVPQGVTGVVPLQISMGGITTSNQVTVALN
jgi:uncharacterized protein (TIGR03437 family)